MWRRLGRRFAGLALGGAIAGVVAFVVALLAGSTIGTAIGVASGTLAAVVIVVGIGLVASSALSGMLRAGERGERLAGDDVGLVPPRRHPLRDPDRGADDDV